MALLVNPNITIIEPKKNERFGYSVFLNRQNKDLNIRATSHCGKSRGIVGTITNDGAINTTDKNVMKYLTPQIKDKISFLVEMMYRSNRSVEFKSGFVRLS